MLLLQPCAQDARLEITHFHAKAYHSWPLCNSDKSLYLLLLRHLATAQEAASIILHIYFMVTMFYICVNPAPSRSSGKCASSDGVKRNHTIFSCCVRPKIISFRFRSDTWPLLRKLHQSGNNIILHLYFMIEKRFVFAKPIVWKMFVF